MKLVALAVAVALLLAGCAAPGPAPTRSSLAFAEQREKAVHDYLSFARDQSDQLVTQTAAFVTAWETGDDTTARKLFPVARTHYEAIEPLAELFTTLDTSIDVRRLDLQPGAAWYGWHRIEEDLWAPAGYTPLTIAGRAQLGDRLEADTRSLNSLLASPSFTLTLSEVSRGAIALLDEVATTKITGEEEVWSHTDLWDFDANIQGARQAYTDVRPIALEKGAPGRALVAEIDADFATLSKTLSQYGSIDTGYVLYNTLSLAQVRQLSDQVNALAEPLSKLTAVVLK